MILFFDTETTGFPNNRLAADDDAQPHLVQLAAILTDRDGTERASISMVVDPGVAIPAGAAAVHKITDDVAQRCGVTPKAAVFAFATLLAKADTLVAHNKKFDLAIMNTAFARHGREFPERLLSICTMETAAPIVNLPPTDRMRAAGFTKPKAPKLEECVQHFFGEKLEGAHDALVDVRACARVYFHLQRQVAA